MPSTSNKQDCIQWYLDAGFTLFPLKGKHPLKNYHWRETTYDPFFEAEENFGIQLRPTDLIIDIDPRNGGIESFERLKIKCSTFTVETGSGGLHHYLSKPAECSIRKNLKEYRGIDFITHGGYVVGAGSIHPDTGNPYFIQQERHIESAPDSLLKILQKSDSVIKHGKDNFLDDEQTKERFREYTLAAAPAIEGQAGDRTTFAVAAVGRDFGLSPSAVLAVMVDQYNPRCQPPWAIEELTQKINNAYKYAQSSLGNKAPTTQFEVWTEEKIEKANKEISKFLQRTSHGTIKANLNNTAILFNANFPVPTLHHLLGFNEFSNNIEYLRPAPWHRNGNVKIWTDHEAILCKYFLSNQWKFEPPTNTMHEAALKVAKDASFHPVKEYLLSLRWDGHKRCHNWLYEIMGANDNAYTRAIGIKFLVAAVKRVFELGCKYDYILTLEGPQGTFKSTVFEILAIKKEWYADPQMDIMNKDSIFMMFGKWIVELPEMHTYFRAETNAMKGFLSRSVDRARMPYERIMRDFPRQCVFGGTINPESDKDIGWLRDTTGNRRYWPVQVGLEHDPKLQDLREVVHQMWAEAYQLYLEGVPVYLEDRDIERTAQDEQAKRVGKDPWQDSIEVWLDAPQNTVYNIFSGEQIYKDCIGGMIDRYGNKEMWRLSHVMDCLGWIKGVHYDKEQRKSIRGYKRPEII